MRSKEWMVAAGVFMVMVIVGWLRYIHQRNKVIIHEEWRQTACPSLLSGDRTFRDTLITMKMLPDCNAYVMETFK